MYKNGYDMVMLNLNSKLEMKIFIAIRDSFSRSKIEINISQVKLAEKFNTTKSTVNRFIKKLVEIG
jgi:predicted transcriptional regulator